MNKHITMQKLCAKCVYSESIGENEDWMCMLDMNIHKKEKCLNLGADVLTQTIPQKNENKG